MRGAPGRRASRGTRAAVRGIPSSLGPSTAGARAARERMRMAGLALCTVLLSCGGPGAATSAAERAGGSPVEIRDGHDYPSLSLVARDGDPFAAIAIAVGHDFGATASVWLAALLEERALHAVPRTVEARPSGGGVVLRTRVDRKEQ